ncbi:MAG TPA: OB-fold domain-containing protein [Thermoplasmata archaeon]|nr:OB-fold domain-containing protein [Thermoplasmata archaeon]
MSAPLPHSIADFRRGYAQEHRLRGFRSTCGFVTATWGLLCPRCGRRDLAEVDLSGRGRIVAATVQTVPAEGFLRDAPYAYVVVELEEGAQVTGWMPGLADPRAVQAGTPVRWRPSEHSGVQFERDPAAPPRPGEEREPPP